MNKETIVQALTIVLHDADCPDRCEPTVTGKYRKMAEAVMASSVPDMIRKAQP